MNQDRIKEIIEEIFTRADCALSSCEFSNENGMLWCVIQTPDSRFMIGRDGETLRSLTHIVRKIVEKNSNEEESAKLFLDVNGYQKKRFDNLRATAHMMAERARYFKSNIEIDPMPAYERRIIHMFLENEKDLRTESEGSGPGRRVVIKYIENK
ncbi:MAG: R3H domain-containing nucleic acid-binding protein [Patescibacteria group bacterium]